MKIAGLLLCAAACALRMEASPFCTAVQGTWCEQATGDAGSLPGTAEATIGAGMLNFIIGQIGDGTKGADMYAVFVANTSLFSASYAGHAGTGVTANPQAALYLFSSNGNGIEAVDDGSATLGGFAGPAGLYYLGVSPDGNTPQYKTGGNSFPIFTAFTPGAVSFPVNGAGPIKNYSGLGCGANCQGGYELSLTGAQYSAVPEPASLALTGSVLLGVGALGLTRRKRSLL